MSGRQAKFCIDRDGVRWILLEGVVTRKTPQDDPTEGKDLPVERITGIEKTSVRRIRRNPLAKPVTFAGLLLLAAGAGMAIFYGWTAVPLMLLGLIGSVWGLKHLSGHSEIHEAYQILAPGTNPEEWRIIGSHPEAQGFIEGVRLEMEAARRSQAAANN